MYCFFSPAALQSKSKALLTPARQLLCTPTLDLLRLSSFTFLFWIAEMLQMAFDPLCLSAQKDCWRWNLSTGKACGYSHGQITSLVCTGETRRSGSSRVGGHWQVEARESCECASLSGKVWGWLVIGVKDGGGVKAEEVRGRRLSGQGEQHRL